MLPGEHWSLDVDLRYLPVARFLKIHLADGSVLEVGSSSKGITPYVDRTVVGSDALFPGEIALTLMPVVARGQLPFRDGSFDAVISLDTLEHVPREFRQLFIDEMFRIARRYVIVGFPEGDAAEQHDAAMEIYFVRQNTEAHEFFVEHREYRIPRQEDVSTYLKKAAESTCRMIDVHRTKNVNITLRSIFMRTVWNKSRLMQKLYTILTVFSRWEWMFHHGTCYRSIYFITMKQSANDR
jgi:hypothetical protein